MACQRNGSYHAESKNIEIPVDQIEQKATTTTTTTATKKTKKKKKRKK